LWYDNEKGIPMQPGSSDVIDRRKIDQLLDDTTLFLSEDEDPLPTDEPESLAPLRRLQLPYRSDEATQIMQRIDARHDQGDRPIHGRPQRKSVASCAESAPATVAQIKQLVQPELQWAVKPEWLQCHSAEVHEAQTTQTQPKEEDIEPGGRATTTTTSSRNHPHTVSSCCLCCCCSSRW
jgi:hypothetical protein